MKTRILCLLAALAAVMTATAYDFKVGGLCYNKNSDGTSVTVTYENESEPRYTSLSGALNLPASVKSGGKTYSVTAIGDYAFAGCTGITSLNIPNSVISVGGYAFSVCSGITTVTVGNSARTWGDYVFRYCYGLTTINWNVPDGVSFTWGGGTGLLPYGNPFYNTGNVKTVVFGNNVKHIPSCFCRSFKKLTSVTIPSSVTRIETWAFVNCESLPKVTLPASVEYIGYEAFRGCKSLASLTIPASVNSIENDAFYGTAWFNNQPDGVVYAGNMAYRYKGTMPAGTSVTLRDNCTGLAYKAFANEKNLKAITLKSNVKYFNGHEFEGCTGLTTVNWNVAGCDDFTSSNAPFKDMKTITAFNFGNSVKYIPAYLCQGLSGLTAVTIPKNVTEVGHWVFENCTGLTRVDITDLAAFCNIDFHSTTSSPLLYGHNLYLNGTLVTKLVIPSTVPAVNSYAFRCCTSITELTIPQTVTTVGNYAFDFCSNLRKVTWNVTAGNDYPYSSPLGYMRGIQTFVFGDNVTRIPSYLCSDITGLTQVTIPSSVTEIGNSAFSNCTGLTRVDISDLAAWLNINFLDYQSNPLYCGKNLYLNGEKVKHLTIPAAVAGVKKYAFYNCTSLSHLTIPSTVTTIDNNAFTGCTGLTTISSKPDPAAVTLGTNVFLRVPVTTCELRVPRRHAEAYRNANQWSAFTRIVSTLEGDVNGDKIANGSDVTALYDILLEAKPAPFGADVNEDGQVNGSDVTALYNLLLSQ